MTVNHLTASVNIQTNISKGISAATYCMYTLTIASGRVLGQSYSKSPHNQLYLGKEKERVIAAVSFGDDVLSSKMYRASINVLHTERSVCMLSVYIYHVI